MLQRQQELQSRTSTLDLDNQDLQTKLAQSQQQLRLVQDDLTTTKLQLRSAADQLAQSRESQQSAQQQAEALAASVKKRTTTTISANNSLERNLPQLNIPGIEVRQDGDVVRVELPTDRLFNTGTAQLRQDGIPLLDTVAAELERVYPNQIVGVEGHTDSDPPQQGMWVTNHQLSIARAGAVFDNLSSARPHAPAATLHRRPRFEPPGRLERHRTGQSPQSSRGVGGVPGAMAAVMPRSGRACFHPRPRPT